MKLDVVKIKNLIIQFFKFGIIGFLNTIISYAITNVCYYVFSWHEQICNLIAFVITVFISFMLNKRFVFNDDSQEKQSFWKSLVKVYVAYSTTGLFLSAILIYIEEQLWGIPHYIATLMNLVVTVPINFLLNKFWVYKDKNKDKKKEKYGDEAKVI